MFDLVSGKTADRSAAARLAKLRDGLHPVTGAALLVDSPVLLPLAAAEVVCAEAGRQGAARWQALVARVRAREAAARGADHQISA